MQDGSVFLHVVDSHALDHKDTLLVRRQESSVEFLRLSTDWLLSDKYLTAYDLGQEFSSYINF